MPKAPRLALRPRNGNKSHRQQKRVKPDLEDSRIRRRKLQFTDLNDDVIRAILTIAHEDAVLKELDAGFDSLPYHYNEPKRLTLIICEVSSRIRGIALSTPALWTFIDSRHMNEKELELHLKRSGRAGLTIRLWELHRDWAPTGESKFEWMAPVHEFMHAIWLHKNRWKRLSLHIRPSMVGALVMQFVDVQRIMCGFGADALTFPALEYLRYDHEVHGPHEVGHDPWYFELPVDVSWDMPAFLGDWNLPALKAYTSIELPTPQMYTNITHFELVFGLDTPRADDIDLPFLQTLWAVLSALHSLVSLTISWIHLLEYTPPDWDDLPLLDTLELPSVKHVCWKDIDSFYPGWDLLAKFDFPNLESLRAIKKESVSCDVRDPEEAWRTVSQDLDDLGEIHAAMRELCPLKESPMAGFYDMPDDFDFEINYILGQLAHFRCIQALDLEYSPPTLPQHLATFIRPFPNLQHLTLRRIHFDFLVGLEDLFRIDHLSQLRTLTLFHCSGITTTWIRTVLSKLAWPKTPKAGDLEMLSVVYHPRVRLRPPVAVWRAVRRMDPDRVCVRCQF